MRLYDSTKRDALLAKTQKTAVDGFLVRKICSRTTWVLLRNVSLEKRTTAEGGGKRTQHLQVHVGQPAACFRLCLRDYP